MWNCFWQFVFIYLLLKNSFWKIRFCKWLMWNCFWQFLLVYLLLENSFWQIRFCKWLLWNCFGQFVFVNCYWKIYSGKFISACSCQWQVPPPFIHSCSPVFSARPFPCVGWVFHSAFLPLLLTVFLLGGVMFWVDGVAWEAMDCVSVTLVAIIWAQLPLSCNRVFLPMKKPHKSSAADRFKLCSFVDRKQPT